MEARFGNALRMGTERALTGSLVRVDANTVRRHVTAMKGLPGPIRGLHEDFGRLVALVAVGQCSSEADFEAFPLALEGKG